MTPIEDLILLSKVWLERPREASGKRTMIQIQYPDIIKILLGGGGLATEDKELGIDQRHGMVEATAQPGTIDHDAGPLSRYWNARNSDQLKWVLISKGHDAPRLSR